MAQHYRCNICKEEYTSKEMQVDHIQPVVDPVKGFEGWDTYIARMFCDKSNLQAICLGCHQIKTKSEKKTSSSIKQSKPKKARSNLKASLNKRS